MDKQKKITWDDLTEEEREEYINQDCKHNFSKFKTYGSEDILSDLWHKNNDSGDLDLDRRILLNQYLEELNKIISHNLSKRQRKVIKLSLHGLSYTEIAETLGISNRAVYDAVHRAKKKIRKKLKAKFEI